MSLWTQLQQLPAEAQRQVHSVYSANEFPLEVRHYMAHWIEQQMGQCPELQPSNPQHVAWAAGFQQELLHEIEVKMKDDSDFVKRRRLEEALNFFKMKYCNNPVGLVAVIKNGLNAEINIVRQYEKMPAPGSPLHQDTQVTDEQITEQLAALLERTTESAGLLRRYMQEQESFCICYHEVTKSNAELQHLQQQPSTPQQQELLQTLQRRNRDGNAQLKHRVTGLLQGRLSLVDFLKGTLERLNGLQSAVLDTELIRWKREQQMAGIGRPFEEARLDVIQEWCEQLADIIWQNRHQIKECQRLCSELNLNASGGLDLLPQLNAHITTLLSSLVTSTFVIEKEPTQVLKTNNRFTATLRLLVGGKLNVYMTPPQVKVSIINEAQANGLLKNDEKNMDEESGNILNCTGTMEYTQSTRQLSITFRNMQLRKIKRAEKKGTESVMDEKFALLFQSQFSIGGGEMVFQVWTLSLPVVVIVHGNQEPHAWATILWDNAFAEQGRTLFQVPEKVPWPRVADMLDTKFKAATGRGLTPENLQYLAGKAFRNPDCQDFSGQLLSWQQFCKDALPLNDRSFTFWDWFFQVMKVTKEHLRAPWLDGSILGFVGRRAAEDMLRASPHATFLLRFSDSELGGVTIAWTLEDQDEKAQPEVFMLQPFTSKDFAIRSLADRISDLTYLGALYPNTPKADAFSRYYTPVADGANATANGYVKSTVVMDVPGFPKHSSSDSCPATPASGVGSPPPQPPQHDFYDANSMGDCGMQYPELELPDDISYDYLADINMEQLLGQALQGGMPNMPNMPGLASNMGNMDLQ